MRTLAKITVKFIAILLLAITSCSISSKPTYAQINVIPGGEIESNSVGQGAVPGEFLIKTKEGISPTSINTSSISQDLKDKGVDVVSQFNATHLLAIKIPTKIEEIHKNVTNGSNTSPISKNITRQFTLADLDMMWSPSNITATNETSVTRPSKTESIPAIIIANTTSIVSPKNITIAPLNETIYTPNAPPKNATQICGIILKDPHIESCQPNLTLSLQSLHETIIPSIHRIGRYLNHNSTGITDLGNKSFGVAVLDTGIDPHSDLNLVDSVTCINSKEHGGKCIPDNTGDPCGHGTHIAGIIGAKNNGNGIVGVAPNIKLYSVKVMGCGIGNMQDVQAGLEYVLSKNDSIKVVNLSFGCAENPFTQCKTSNTVVSDDTINGAAEMGKTFVVAAGNGDDQNRPINALHFWPAYNPNVITVAAITDTDGICGGKGDGVVVKLRGGQDIRIEKDDTYADFSNYGPVIAMAAPGVGVNSTYLHNSYKVDSGTSMAAPFVSGAAAVYLASHPLASPVEVRTELLKRASNSAISCIYPPGDDRGYFNSTSPQTNVPLLNLDNMR